MTLGALGAEDDISFDKHFISTGYLKRLATDHSDIIYGTKGSGKTALCRALTEMHSDMYEAHIIIDLNNLSFQAVHHKLNYLKDFFHTEATNISRTTWQHIILSYGLLAFSEKLNETDVLKKSIRQLLLEDNFTEADHSDHSPNTQILNAIERLFERVMEIPAGKKRLIDDVGPEQQRMATEYNFNPKLNSILESITGNQRLQSKKILICIDGFDTIVDHTRESREIIFGGLINGILKLASNHKVSKCFCVKAFLPQELTRDSYISAWDSDKFSDHIHRLSWWGNDLRLLVERRLQNQPRTKHTRFDDLWSELMPETVINRVHAVEENTFDYIIRHTLYRPRQVLDHLQNIMSRWKESNSTDTRISPTFIPSAIAKNNIEMARRTAEQLNFTYPSIIPFLKSWQDTPTIVESKVVRDKINKYFKEGEYKDQGKVFNDLFNLGIFGVHSKQQRDSAKKNKFRFAFIGDQMDMHIHNSIGDDDLVAIAPMFTEFCGCQPSESGIIAPVSLSAYDHY